MTRGTGFVIRPLDASAAAEVELVAERMRLTLIEVEGEAGGAMYSMDWLRARVRWHLDPAQSTGAVFLAQTDDGAIAGHTIVRVEHDAGGRRFGLVSTTYVDPAQRRGGIADALLQRGEQWFAAQGLNEACTWTSATNAPLIALYARHGYAEAERGAHAGTGTTMVRLARTWA